MHPTHHRTAFSLVELSIVLVILGLLVGGILAGQSLIRAAELRSVSADFTRYQTASSAFRDKYAAIPGDIQNATSFWGAADGNDGLGTDCQNITTPATGTATCNGNGNGLIGEYNGTSNCISFYERFRMWQHLANAGLVEGSLTGVYEPGSLAEALPCRRPTIGSNVPRSRIANAGFEITGYTGATPTQWGSIINRIYFGGPGNYGGAPITELWGPVLKTEEAWNLDTKLDDGTPFNGNVTSMTNSFFGSGANCVTSTAQNAAYDLAQTSIQCSLAMKLGL